MPSREERSRTLGPLLTCAVRVVNYVNNLLPGRSGGRIVTSFTTRRRELATVAQRTVITLIDDLDHKEIEADGQTIRFAYQGIQYETDPSEKNAEKLDKALAPFLAAARRVSCTATRPKAIAAGVDTRAVRKWQHPTGSRCQPEAASPRTSLGSIGLLAAGRIGWGQRHEVRTRSKSAWVCANHRALMFRLDED